MYMFNVIFPSDPRRTRRHGTRPLAPESGERKRGATRRLLRPGSLRRLELEPPAPGQRGIPQHTQPDGLIYILNVLHIIYYAVYS